MKLMPKMMKDLSQVIASPITRELDVLIKTQKGTEQYLEAIAMARTKIAIQAQVVRLAELHKEGLAKEPTDEDQVIAQVYLNLLEEEKKQEQKLKSVS